MAARLLRSVICLAAACLSAALHRYDNHASRDPVAALRLGGSAPLHEALRSAWVDDVAPIGPVMDSDMVLVLPFDGRTKGHMMRTVFGTPYSFKYQVADPRTVEHAFSIVGEQRPRLAIWLLPFNFGDIHGLLPKLAHGFDLARRRLPDTRHGVFHWSPEKCDWHNATLASIEQAYENVDFVFQFGYQDERLSSKDSEKYLPWPLGTAGWRGWQAPEWSALAPLGQREHLAVYRGTSGTHGAWIEKFNDQPGVIVESRTTWTVADSEADARRYKELLCTGQYALAPAGHNPNCYRILEAVECGAIPVIQPGAGKAEACYDNWSSLYGFSVEGSTTYPWIPKAPFVALRSWSEFPQHLSSMRAAASDELEDKLQLWYTKWQAAFHAQLEMKVRNILASE